MSENYIGSSNRQTDELYRNCRTAEDVREVARQQLEAQGIISRDRGGDVVVNSGEPLIRPVTAVPVPARNIGKFSRVIYPGGNDRYELFGDSEQELDTKEARLRSAYGPQR
jgi:hypothetical protein